MRYDRQEVLKHIGKQGQKKLSKSSAVIVGLGSTGTVTAELLARAGVGKLVLIDHDIVEESNLNRQTLYDEQDINAPKSEAAAKRLRKINNEIEIKEKKLHLDTSSTEALNEDVILDCTDNMQTRLLINDYAMKKNIPWIYAAAVEDRGMVYVTNDSPCFKCVFEKAKSLENCETAGILNTASTQVSTIQATEALKILLGEKPAEDLIAVNLWKNEYQKYGVQKNPKCPTCNGKYDHLESKEGYTIEYCDSKATMSAKPKEDMNLNLEKIKETFNVKADAGIVTVIELDDEEVVVHDYGELLFKTEDDEDKLREIADKIYEKGLKG